MACMRQPIHSLHILLFLKLNSRSSAYNLTEMKNWSFFLQLLTFWISLIYSYRVLVQNLLLLQKRRVFTRSSRYVLDEKQQKTLLTRFKVPLTNGGFYGSSAMNVQQSLSKSIELYSNMLSLLYFLLVLLFLDTFLLTFSTKATDYNPTVTCIIVSSMQAKAAQFLNPSFSSTKILKSSIGIPILAWHFPSTMPLFLNCSWYSTVIFIGLTNYQQYKFRSQKQLGEQMNRSQISNDFNFDMELDISKSKKDKTENFFSKEGFAFEDFMNIDQRTMKSQKFQSKLGHNMSQISKDAHGVDQISSQSIKRKMTRDQMLIRSSTSHNLTLSGNVLTVGGAGGAVPSPKFAEASVSINTSKSIPVSPKKQRQFTLRRVPEQNEQSGPQITNISLMPDQNHNAFRKKDTPETAMQNEYKSLESQIKFYEEQTQKMIYENTKVEEQTENLMMNFNVECYQKQLQQHAVDINEINKQIEEEKQLECQLAKMIVQLEQEYDNGLYSIKNSRFPRPTIIKDEAKVLIDQINELKTELQALERDDGSLNLSSTIMNTHSMQQPSSVVHKKPEEIARAKIQEIEEENQTSEDPRFMLNLKMACLKTQWCLFSNSDLQVNVSYRDVPKVVLRLGNKLPKDLQQLTLKHNTTSCLEGQTIAARSYYSHIFQVTPALVNQLFARVELSYEIGGERKNIILFVPLGLTNFGQFSPITQKQFQNDAGKQPFAIATTYRPLDKKLISSVSEITVFMPNLITGAQMCSGLFIFPFQDCELVTFRQRGEMLSIATKNQNWPLLRLLQFIFTV